MTTNPMLTEKHNEGKYDIDADILYFKNKLKLAEENGEDTSKILKQIELLEDSIIVYRLSTPAREKNV